MTIFDYQGTSSQRALAREAMEVRCDFPWDRLLPGLQRQTGRTSIPIDWQDLSRYGQAQAARAHKTADPVIVDPVTGDKAWTIEYRHRVLGLAWYSGRVTLEVTLEQDPTLAGEVLLSEGAHMWDFFGMTDDDRIAVWNAVHPPDQQIAPGTNIEDGVDLGHGHGWFDVAGYYAWVGEALMGLFVEAFSDYPVTIAFQHAVTADAARKVRELVYPPAPEPEPPTEPAFYGFRHGKVYHLPTCWVVRLAPATPPHGYVTAAEAKAAGRRPCRICKPGG